jgi:glycine hydroxymethyltransferase
MKNALEKQDSVIAGFIRREDQRQSAGIEMIASENYTSTAVRIALGSGLTNKYAEGLPGKRYYGGCEVVDDVEQVAIDRAKHLFGAEHANVQPHDGSGANRAMYRAAGLRASRAEDTKKGTPADFNRDVLVSLGGGVEHLTHGKKVSATGKEFEVHHYGLKPETFDIDVAKAAELAAEFKGRMKVLLVGYSSYWRQIPEQVFADLAEIAHKAEAKFAVDMAHFAGLVAGKQHASPVPHADFVSSTSHKTLRGPRAGFVLSKAAEAKALDRAVFPELQGGPHMHVIAGKAVCFAEAMSTSFQRYAAAIIENVRTLAERLRVNGVPVLGGDADANHLLLLDVGANDGPGGQRVETALNASGITVNKNALPFDTRPPMDPSGIRVGTAAVTTRTMGKQQMEKIGDWMSAIIKNPDDTDLQSKTLAGVHSMTNNGFLVPGSF